MPKRDDIVQVGNTYQTKHGTFTVRAKGETSVDVRHESGRLARYTLSDFENWIIPEKKP